VKLLSTLLIIPLLGLPAQEGIGSSPGGIPASTELPAAPFHDLHATYGNLGVDGALAVLQFRAFKNDLEGALGRFHEMDHLRLDVSPEVDGIFLRYLSEKFILEVDGQILEGRIIGSGDDELDREPVWWYQVRFDAPEPIQSARITNTILFEIFDDQNNVLRVVEFPEENRRAYYFAPGEETIEITF
jgi:hypothetical protein